MKLIEIPEDTNELRDYNKFINTIVEVQKFNRNVSSFLKKVLYDEFFKTFKDWMNSASEEERKQLEILDYGPEFKIENYDENKWEHLHGSYKNEMFFEKGISKLKIYNYKWSRQIFYCYKTNTFIVPNSNKYPGDYFPLDRMNCTPTDDGLGMYVSFKHTWKKAPTPGWLPTYHAELEYEINLLDKSVKQIADKKTETNNNHY